MFTHLLKRTVPTIALMTTLVSAHHAIADTNVATGAICKNMVFSLSSSVQYGHTGMIDTRTGGLATSFTCPIDRRDALNTNDVTDIYVRVRDNSTTTGFSCLAWSCNSLGTTCTSTASVGSSGTGDFSLFIGNVATFNGGAVSVMCHMPPSDSVNGPSRITSVRYTD